MGIFAKSLSCTRYFVRGETPPDFLSWADERLQSYLFREIDDTNDEKAWGWVELDNLLQTSFEGGQAHKGEYLAFSLRIDTRKGTRGDFPQTLSPVRTDSAGAAEVPATEPAAEAGAEKDGDAGSAPPADAPTRLVRYCLAPESAASVALCHQPKSPGGI